jgi:hypothetical protein
MVATSCPLLPPISHAQFESPALLRRPHVRAAVVGQSELLGRSLVPARPTRSLPSLLRLCSSGRRCTAVNLAARK